MLFKQVMVMLILEKENNGEGAFYVEQNGEAIAEMTYYRPTDGVITINHTEVEDEYQGQNIARQLLDHAVEFARSKQLKIIARCPYVKSMFEKYDEYNDVWKR